MTMVAAGRIGFIVPAVDGEGDLLSGCLANLLAQADRLPHLEFRIIVCWQSDAGSAPAVPDDPRIGLLTMGRIGASAARNRGLEALAGQVDALMFADVSVRPGAAFLSEAWDVLRDAPLVSAPVGFDGGGAGERQPGRRTRVRAGFVVFRGFIWSTLFRAESVHGLRFDETVGPGTPSAHQSGEDARLLYRIVTRLGLATIPYLPGMPVHRLPRQDLAEKQWRYAFGQGYLVGQYLWYPTPDGRLYFLWRAVLFLGRSALMLGRGRSSRALGLRRACAFLAGIRGQDRSVPSLSTKGGALG